VWEDLAAGRLEAVIREWSLPAIALSLVTPPSGLRPARVSALIEHLTHRLSAASWAVAAETAPT
jgi:DNA-binding transcriptional LysR family regulator